MASKNPIIKGSMISLTQQARELFAEVGIHVKKTSHRKVFITQHYPDIGTSFQFEGMEKEYHIPARMVPECFA